MVHGAVRHSDINMNRQGSRDVSRTAILGYSESSYDFTTHSDSIQLEDSVHSKLSFWSAKRFDCITAVHYYLLLLSYLAEL